MRQTLLVIARRRFVGASLASLALLTSLITAGAAQAAEPIQSATKLVFGDANTLFVADWQGARIHALRVPQVAAASGKPFNLKDVQGPIAQALRVDRSRLLFGADHRRTGT